jgi:hypothetical protein
MSVSETDIANMALDRLGHQTISSFDQGTKAADLCSRHYARCRDSLLRAHPWNFAIKRATLGLSTTTPNHEFTYQHALPVDCLKVIRTSWEADGYASSAVYGFPGMNGYAGAAVPYRIEGRFLLCNEDVAKIEYVAQITDTAQFDELFVDVLAQRLAAEIGMALTDNASAVEKLWGIYQTKLNEARLMDAQEGTPREVVDLSPWITARA